MTLRVQVKGLKEAVERIAAFIEDVLSRNTGGCADALEGYEVAIAVRVPKGLTHESAMLVLDWEEAEAINELTSLCGKPKVREEGGEQVFEWLYRGGV